VRTNNGSQTKQGRPTKYQDNFPEIAEKYIASCGATMEELAKFLDVNPDTLYAWKDEHPAFSESIQKGRDAYDCVHIERSLKERAMGFEYDEVKEESVVLKGVDYIEVSESEEVGTNKAGEPVYKQVKKLRKGIKRSVTHKKVAPSDIALMFWLQNRDPERWKNVQKQYVSGNIKHEHEHKTVEEEVLENMPREELEQIRDSLAKASEGIELPEPGRS